ncbi:hypothetical protein E3N88_20378 [Mikania micrantha]|uniref:Uncharacterized protein n=1 Tax=Mikania micrantha TaxID=192012 RepID=A0A5N6NJE6_9ASTR|nr:hypothetical protein E3N88_20378 [Mikania micrantha]
MSRNDDRNRKIRENRFKTRKLGLLGFSGTHRGTRCSHRRNHSGTRQASREFAPEILHAIGGLLEAPHWRIEACLSLGSSKNHHHLTIAEVPCYPEALEAVITIILKI